MVSDTAPAEGVCAPIDQMAEWTLNGNPGPRGCELVAPITAIARHDSIRPSADEIRRQVTELCSVKRLGLERMLHLTAQYAIH